MKSVSLLFLVLISTLSVHAQYHWSERFEPPFDDYRSHFVIDTINYHHNLWQIGKPSKVVFDSAYSLSNALVTDTLYPCAAHDTSVFILYSILGHSSAGFLINFKYKLDIDSGNLAKIEISGDNGVNWINPITEDTAYQFYWGHSKPRLDSSSLSWQNFDLALIPWVFMDSAGPPLFPHYRTSDTLLFRFTFISDSDTTAKDGWMLDDFNIEHYEMVGNTNLLAKNDLLNIYPVPSAGQLLFHTTGAASDHASITIYNIKGQQVYKEEQLPASGILNLPLSNGDYVLKYATEHNYALKRITILR